MKRLIIIGAGSFGREVLEYAIDIEKSGRCEWKIGGFLDDNMNALNNYEVKYPIIGRITEYLPADNDVFISAFGNGQQRVKYGRGIAAKGGKFTSLIHPSARILNRVKIGQGAIISMNTLVANDTVCGDYVYLNYGAVVGHDNQLGIGCTLNTYCGTNGHCTLGDYVFMGAHSTIVPGKRVGDYVNISAGAAVFNNIKGNTTVYGNPAKILK